MCGIFGVWNYKDVTAAHVARASQLLEHRGPDDKGCLAFDTSGMASDMGPWDMTPPDTPCHNALLHRRLSILDLSSAGRQPMQLGSRRIYIVFNGEVYNFRELAALHHIETRTGTDTEVVLHMYAKYGTACFAHFRGMWAMSILDLEKDELILSRDRFGIKPLYYSHNTSGFAFSSEIKPLLQLPGVPSNWSKSKLYQFLIYGATQDKHETFFDQVRSLEPGTSLVYKLGSGYASTSRWYKLSEAIGSRRDSDPSEFESLFGESIREHLIADVEVGSCLSGGLDSSAIVACASKGIEGFKTFTCSFPGTAIDEGTYALMLQPLHPGLEQHFTTPDASDFMGALDHLVLMQERPPGSASVFAQYTVMKLASEQGIKVLLDGQGADEVFGGYYPFAGAYLLELLRSGQVHAFMKQRALLKANFNPAMNKAMLRAAFYRLPQPLQLYGRSRGRLGYSIIAQPFSKEAMREGTPQRGASCYDELALRSIGFGLYELLHYEDRNSMAFGIESRVPFLDHRLVEWALKLPVYEKMKDGWTKYPIRHYLDSHGLKSLAWRRDKLGFVAPQEQWRTALAPALSAQFRESVLSEVLDRSAIQRLFSAEMSSAAQQSEFWRIWGLLRWMELMKVQLVDC